MHGKIIAALQALYPGSVWTLTGDDFDKLIWFPENKAPIPSKDEILNWIEKQDAVVPESETPKGA